MSESQIQDLQIKQAFLERHIEEQDRVIYGLQTELEKLRAEVRKLAERADSQSGSNNEMPADEKPPHY
ncbi:SlyX family protein [Pelagicoccus mobilis]|uniref:SlyX family protein n=2 Tax=Pelagicoccus mobilis TaxID=415221 RepID=A0A934RZW6_9BACT|nr:SlyX family protein [Pelagicoccus mobilis]